jgi:hypothetical protein
VPCGLSLHVALRERCDEDYLRNPCTEEPRCSARKMLAERDYGQAFVRDGIERAKGERPGLPTRKASS